MSDAERSGAGLLARPAYPVDGGAVILRGTSLPDRLRAVARLVQIGSARAGMDGIGSAANGATGFSPGLLADAEALLARAGERLGLSATHTIVVLAGGTGSGKSSLFNQLAGAEFSPVGVLRPVTREPLACVWGMEGAGPLLDWLGIPPRHRYARSSALDEGERALTGLLLVDLPDHDSVITGDAAQVSRLVAQADLMVWVLDPQKYADAAVHRRYLMPMAGHASVIAAALNQADLLTPEQAGECVADLRRLLDAEGLHGARVLVTSATTGEGVAELRRVLIETVVARQAAVQRIGADVDALAARFARYAADDGVRRRLSAAVPRPRAGLRGPSASDGPEGAAAGVRSGGGPGHAGGGKGLANAEPEPPANAEPEPPADAQPEASANAGPEPPAEAEQEASANAAPEPPAEAEQEAAARLTYATGALAETFAVAAGVSGVCSALRSARELKAVDYVGWPMAWLADRVARRDPARKVRLGALWDELRGASAGSAGAQQAEINSAITAFADEAGRGLPGLWHASVRHAARSNVHDIPAALGVAIGEALPQENKVAPWWRAVAAWQGLLLGAVAVGLGWLVAILVLGVFGAAPHAALLLRDAGLLPWVAPMVAAVLLLGWLTANGSMALVIREAEGDRLHAEFQMRAGIADVARRLVVAPVEQELSEFARFHAELAVARGAG